MSNNEGIAGLASPSVRTLGDDLSEEEDSTGTDSEDSDRSIPSIPTLSSEESSDSDWSTDSGSTKSSNTTVIMSTKKVTLDGEEIEVSSAVVASGAALTTLYLKADREELKKVNKLNELFEKATRTRIAKLDLVTLTLSEEDKLDDTCSLGIQIGRIRAHFTRYDMHDVMGIVTFGATGLDDPTGRSDLFALYSSITEKEVALSNQWYNEYTTAEWYRQNLQLTLEFLENNTTTALWEKCLEVYEEYPANQRGGPLMFLIIMKKLQSHTEAATKYLSNSIENMKLTNFEGESVSRATSLIRGAYKRLKLINKVPEDFEKWVLKVFQTSTVPEFNQAFQHIQREVEVVKPLLTGKAPKYPSLEDLVRMAEQQYLDLASTNTWTGVGSKINQSGFVAKDDAKKKMSCWNCGQQGHSLNECTKPKNNEIIEQRRKAYRETKKKGKGNGKGKEGENKDKKQDDKKDSFGKFAPPTESEKSRRIIDGKPMYWASRIKKWINDKRANPAQSANPAVQKPPENNGNAVSDQEKLGQELTLSNVQHQINTAMQTLMNIRKEY